MGSHWRCESCGPHVRIDQDNRCWDCGSPCSEESCCCIGINLHAEKTWGNGIDKQKMFLRAEAGTVSTPIGKIKVDYLLGGCGLIVTMPNRDQYFVNAMDIIMAVVKAVEGENVPMMGEAREATT
jgi:hypothetical protein